MTAERLQISQGTSQGVRPEPKGEEERKIKLSMSDMRRLVPGWSIRPQPAGLDAIPPRLRQAEKYNSQMSTWAIYIRWPKSCRLLAATTALLHYCLCGPSVRPSHQTSALEISTAVVRVIKLQLLAQSSWYMRGIAI